MELRRKERLNKMVVIPDKHVPVDEKENIDELKGKMTKSSEEKMMNSVMENDKDTIDKGKLIQESINNGLGAFTPDMMYSELVSDYNLTKKLYGEKIIRLLYGYDPNYIEKNLNIPEFQKVLKENAKQNVERLKKEGLIDKDGNITDSGYELASLVLYAEEVDNITPKGIYGTRFHKKASNYGGSEDTRDYRKGDRYKDIELKKSVKSAIRRGHSEIQIEDIKVYEKTSKGQIYLIYAIDSSGSMKGKKIAMAKKAGAALCYKAMQEKDKVGLLVFSDEIKDAIEPCSDFMRIIKEMTKIRAGAQTDLVMAIKRAITLFPSANVTKHLLFLTDAMPTKGEEPERETMEYISLAVSHGITISLIGLGLDRKGRILAEKITEIGKGKLYVVENLEELDKIVLQDYYGVG